MKGNFNHRVREPESAKQASGLDTDHPNISSEGAAFPELVIWIKCSLPPLAAKIVAVPGHNVPASLLCPEVVQLN